MLASSRWPSLSPRLPVLHSLLFPSSPILTFLTILSPLTPPRSINSPAHASLSGALKTPLTSLADMLSKSYGSRNTSTSSLNPPCNASSCRVPRRCGGSIASTLTCTCQLPSAFSLGFTGTVSHGHVQTQNRCPGKPRTCRRKSIIASTRPEGELWRSLIY